MITLHNIYITPHFLTHVRKQKIHDVPYDELKALMLGWETICFCIFVRAATYILCNDPTGRFEF